MHSHPSTYWFQPSKLLMTVYVDDIMLSGPSANHAIFWEKLREHVHTGEPDDLDRFLGRHHEVSEVEIPDADFFKFFEPSVPCETEKEDET